MSCFRINIPFRSSSSLDFYDSGDSDKIHFVVEVVVLGIFGIFCNLWIQVVLVYFDDNMFVEVDV